jgi:hypothetical protein
MSLDDMFNRTLTIKRLAAVLSSAAETVGGADTTLVADTAAGALTFNVDDGAGIMPAIFLRLGDAREREIAEVAAVLDVLDEDDVYLYTTVTPVLPLMLPHDSADQVREVDGAGVATVDENGYEVTAPVTVATVAGRIRPLTAAEVPLASQAGAVVSTHVGYIWPLSGLDTGCWVETGGVRYDMTGILDGGGQGHHLELQLRAVV